MDRTAPTPNAHTHTRIPRSATTITIVAGQTLVIETIAPEEDLQTFLVPSDDSFEERDEQYAGAWYRTWGTLLSPASDNRRSLNSWAMVPGEQDDSTSTVPPDDGRATACHPGVCVRGSGPG